MLGKETIIDLSEFLNTRIRVKLTGREVSGTLKSYDKIPNLVLEDTIEHSCDNRDLGIVILRGQMIFSIMPDKLEQIENPFK
jgi:small nuclear ribonucleoprotein (snRNP)-like protein